MFFVETATARTRAMRQLVSKRGLRQLHHTHYSPHYGDKGGRERKYSNISCHFFQLVFLTSYYDFFNTFPIIFYREEIVLFQTLETKVRREYQMAPKVTIS